MKQITIYDLLPLLQDGYVAMDKSGFWYWFSERPYKKTFVWIWGNSCDCIKLTNAFNIAPFDGDWKDSLIKCGESAIIKKNKEVEQ